MRTLSSSSVGRLSCLVVCPLHCCRRCRRRRHPLDICPVEATSPSLSGRGLVIHPPCRHRRPWAVCPVEATLLLLSSGPRRMSPTSLLSSAGHLPCKGLVAVVIRWGVTSSVPHHCHRCRRPPPTLLLSLLLLSATPYIVVVVVVHRPFVLWRLHCHHHPVGALSSIPRVVVISHPPHHCHHRHCHRRWGSSSAPNVVIIVICRSFVLLRLRHHHRPVGASSSVPRVVVVSRPPCRRRRHRCHHRWGSSSTPHFRHHFSASIVT